MLNSYLWQFQTYNVSGTYKFDINPNDIIGDWGFSSALDGGQGALTLNIKTEFNTSQFVIGDFLIITQFDSFVPTGRVLYRGYITSVMRSALTKNSYVTIGYEGIFTVMNDILAGSVYTFAGDVQTFFQNYITTLNTYYSAYGIHYTVGSIQSYPGMSVAFSFPTILNAFEQMQKLIPNWHWYVDQTGLVSFGPKPSTPTHTFTWGTNINSIKETQERLGMCNALTAGGTHVGNSTVTDGTSISTYGRIEQFIEKDNLGNTTQRDNFLNASVAASKDPVTQIEIEINNQYDILTINPGDTFQIMNWTNNYTNLQIVKVQWRQNTAVLTVELARKLTDYIISIPVVG